MAWDVAYEVDWRDAFSDLGPVDLNSPGASFTYEGVTWRTPAVADGNPVDQVNSTLWQLEAAGLHCIEPDNSLFRGTNQSAPHIYATLVDIANNTATPFDPDPTRPLIFQAYVSDLTLTPVNNEGAMVGLYKLNFGVGIGNDNLVASVQGQESGLGPINWGRAGTGASPPDVTRPGLNVSVVCVHWVSSQRYNVYAADWDGVGDWPSNAAFRFISAYRSTVDFNNDLICDPPTFRVAAAVHNSTTIASGYDGTIQRFRILQEVRPS